MKEDLIDLTGKLVSFESVSENFQQKRAVLEFAQKWLNDKGIETKWFDHPHSPSLIASVKGDVEKTVLLSGHLDVVPASKSSFKMKNRDGKLFGRGVLDDKGSCAILMVFLSQILGKKGYPSFELLLTTDEEVGGVDGVGRLVSLDTFAGIDAVFVLDGGSYNKIVTKTKGVLHILIQTTGVACHGSRPWSGVNAIDKALAIYEEIKKLIEVQKQVRPNNWYSTVSVGQISGGTMINQVPDKAEIGLDIRFTEEWSLDDIREEVLKIVKRNDGEVLKLSDGDLLDSDEKHPLIRKYIKMVSLAIGSDISVVPEHGASDARYFNSLKVPIWIHYPDGGGYHVENEWVNVDSMEKLLVGLIDFFGSLSEGDFN